MIATKRCAMVAAGLALGLAGAAWAAADTNPNQPHQHGTASYRASGVGFVDVRYWACDNASRLVQITGQIEIDDIVYTIEPHSLFIPCNVPNLTVNITVAAVCPGPPPMPFVPTGLSFQYTSNAAGVRADALMDINLPGPPPTTQSGTFNHWN
jgi:hypothetical protein